MHYLGRLLSILISYSLLVAIAEKVFTFSARLYVSRRQRNPKQSHSIAAPTSSNGGIKPLHDFDYRVIEPIKYRPFETKRHVVMGIKKSAREEWIRIDQKYMGQMNLRQQLMREFPDTCMGNSNISDPAIRELYEEILLELLPKRYPTIFRVIGDSFLNLVTGSTHTISKALMDPSAMLRFLGENVQEDFYFMVPDGHNDFRLQGFVSCFPQGFLATSRVGMSMSEIHEPVPGYEGRLEKGVNRCFQRMERGQSIGRQNWAIQANHDTLFLPYEGANTLKDDNSPSKNTDVDPSSSFLRAEYHTLTCLPRTGTIVFAVRTYLTPLTEIRDEGLGSLLADSCELMPEKFGVYKNRPAWGPKICTWLRNEGADAKNLDHEAPSSKRACPFPAQPLK